MNIIVQAGAGANFQIKKSFASAFSLARHPTIFWQEEGKSPHDLFKEFSPNIFIGSTWQLNRALVKNLIKTENLKVVLSANHWGSTEIDKEKYPIEFASDKEKTFVEELIKNKVQLYGMCQYLDSYVNRTHDLWKDIGLTVKGIPLSCDVTDYFPMPRDKKYEVEIGFCGGAWRYKNENLNKYLLPLTYPTFKYRTVIFGSGWSTVNAVGRASEETVRNFYSNAMIIPAIFEPHTEIIPDLPQRIFQVAGCRGFQISQSAVGLREIFSEDELITADNPKDFFEKVIYYLNRYEETESFREKSFKRVMSEHTNIHRSIELLQLIGEDSLKLEEVISNLYEKYRK